ncbi:hypothetical protein ACFFK0_01255 [Paenibacillus chartarius]|uniref:DUF1700 domain-containing protein n=1 Tax=Paenibacillus chartarius TaxID=747481 RepID=A0ABV6DEQ5_9BACL
MGKMEYFRELEYRLRGLPERERQNIIAVYEELFQKAEENGKSENDIVDSLGFPRVPNWDTVNAKGDSGAGVDRSRTEARPGHPQEPISDPERSAAPANFESPRDQSFDPAAPHVKPPLQPPTAPSAAAPQGGAGIRSFIPPYTPPSTPAPPVSPQYRDTGFAPPPYREKPGSGAKPWIAGLALGFFNLVFIIGPYLGLLGCLFGLWVTAILLLFSPLLALIGTGIPNDNETMLLLIFGSIGLFGAGLMLTIILQFISKWFFKLSCMYVKFNWNIIKGA